MKKFNSSAYYFLYLSATSILVAYFSLFLKEDLGLSERQITNIFTIQFAIGLVLGPLGAYASDKIRRKSIYGALFFFLNAVILLLLGLNPNDLAIIYILLVLHFIFKIFGPGLIDKITFEFQDEGVLMFSKVRGWGALGYAISVLVAGQFITDEYSFVFYIVAAFYVINAIQVLIMNKNSDSSDSGSSIVFRDMIKMVGNRRIMFIAFMNIFIFAPSSINANIRPLYIGDIITFDINLGLGIVILLNSMFELPLMQITGDLITKKGYRKIFTLATIFSVIQFFGYFLAGELSNQILLFIFVSLNGVVMALYIPAQMQWTRESVPKNQFITAVAVPSIFTTFGMMFFTQIVGIIWAEAGLKWGYMLLSLISCFGLITIQIYFRKGEYNGER